MAFSKPVHARPFAGYYFSNVAVIVRYLVCVNSGVLALCCGSTEPRNRSDTPLSTQSSTPATSASATPATNCSSISLQFRPNLSSVYSAVIEEESEGSLTKPYRSILRFSREKGAWAATEQQFSGPYSEEQSGDLSSTELVWQLDERGIPTTAPVVHGKGKVSLLSSVSMFAFRPVGISLGSICEGSQSSATWVDSANRRRTVNYSITSVRDNKAYLTISGSVETNTNQWLFDGTMSVSLSDGFTGETRIHVQGPGAPRVNNLERVIMVTETVAPLNPIPSTLSSGQVSDASPSAPSQCPEVPLPQGFSDCYSVELTGAPPCESICTRPRRAPSNRCCVEPVEVVVLSDNKSILKLDACNIVPPECANRHGHGNMDSHVRVFTGPPIELMIVEGGCEMRASMHGYVPRGVAAWAGCEKKIFRWDGKNMVPR